MKLSPLALIVTLVFLACGSSKKNESSVSEEPQPETSTHRLAISVDVNGDLNEWPQPLPGYSKETMLHFGITNNKDFLFIAVACGEDRIQQKMLRTGMEMYISENGKKETLTGIGFPLPATMVPDQKPSADGIKTPEQISGEYKASRRRELTKMQVFGFSKIDNGIYSLNEKGSKVAYSWGDNSFLNIEYAIPIKEVFADVSSINAKNIQIGFKLSGFSNAGSNRQSGSYSGGGMGGGGMRGGGGGMRGGGMRGGGMGGGMRGGGMRQSGEGGQGTNNMQDLAKDQSFWTKYTISTTGK